MPPYLRLGSIPRKRHIAHPHEPGFKGEGIYYEEVVTLAGFSRAYSIVYHLRPPTRVVADRAGRDDAARISATQPTLRHHHLKTADDPPRRRPDHRPASRSSATTTSSLARCRPEQPQAELYRNADADEIVFVHSRPGHAAHHVRPAAVSRRSITSSSPAARPIASNSTPAAQPDLLVIESAGNVSIPAAVSEPRRPVAARAPLQRARPPRPARDRRRRSRGGDDRPDQGRPPADPLHAGAAIRSTSSAGTAWFIPTRSTPTISSRSPAPIHQPPPVHQTFEAPGVRGLHVRPAAARHPPRGDQGAVCPLQRAGRRGALLCAGPVRQPAGRRGGVVHAAPARHPARPAPRHHRRQPGRRLAPTSWPSWSTPSGRCS